MLMLSRHQRVKLCPGSNGIPASPRRQTMQTIRTPQSLINAIHTFNINKRGIETHHAIAHTHPGPHVYSSPPTPLVLAQTLPHALPTPSPIVLVLALLLLTQHPRRLDVCGALLVRAVKQADCAEQDRLGRLHGTPPLRRRFIAVLVLLRRMQDGNAQLAILVNVGVERNRVLERERGRHVRVVLGKGESSTKVAS